MKIELKVLNKEFYEDNLLPEYATAGSAAIDLVATQDYAIEPREVVEIRTGLAIWINSGQKEAREQFAMVDRKTWYNELWSVAALILPRSGRGAREGLVIANTVGLIDSDYQGELVVYAMNRREGLTMVRSHALSGCFGVVNVDRIEQNTIRIKAGERFAQMTFVPIIKAQFDVVEEFSSESGRGDGGFGSTGNE